MGSNALEQLAEQIGDAREIDWAQARSSMRSSTALLDVEALRLVDSVAKVHRALGSTPDAAAEPDRATAVGAAHADAESDRPPRWGSFTIEKVLGDGRSGTVFEARDPHVDRPIALKLLRRDFDHGQAAVVREARLLAKVRHPNVVTVHGAGREDGRVGLWMERIDGQTLADIVRAQGPWSAEEAALVGIDLCRALTAIHGAGLVHGDLKAHNVMRAVGGRTVLMDFSSARPVDPASEEELANTQGSPAYMAPELFLGQRPTRSSDIYAQGVLLYYLVTGTFPVLGHSMAALVVAHTRGQRTSLRDRRSDLPESFVRVVERATAPTPEQRYGSLGEMEEALSGVVRPHQAPPQIASGSSKRAAGVTGALLAVAIVALIALWPFDRGYSVEAAFVRGTTTREPLVDRARVAVGDPLSLEIEGSEPLYVYVLSEDALGRASVLFPLPNLEPQNPLPPGRLHRLPGKRNGSPLYWQVDSAGEEERFLIVASPSSLPDFEAEIASVPRPDVAPANGDEEPRLRGVQSLVEGSDQPRTGTPSRLFERARRLSEGHDSVSGVWVREFRFSNPG
jgi:serine/threonine protein kinase